MLAALSLTHLEPRVRCVQAPDGGVAIADTRNHRVQIFVQEQEKIKWSRVVGARHSNLPATNPRFPATDRSIVGMPLQVGARGKGKVEFQNPFGVACNPHVGTLYVADTSNQSETAA